MNKLSPGDSYMFKARILSILKTNIVKHTNLENIIKKQLYTYTIELISYYKNKVYKFKAYSVIFVYMHISGYLHTGCNNGISLIYQ